MENERLSKLSLEGQRIILPDPDTLIEGWEDSAFSYPELSQINVEKYSDESELSIIFHTPTAQFKPELVYGCTIMVQDILNASAGLQSKKEEERIENAT